MSVISYLGRRATEAVLSENEKSSIARSIGTLNSRLDLYFPGQLQDRFQFGSSTRGTILPRSLDDHSDIDFMVVFSDAGYTPQAYLDRLKRFVSTYYSTSTIYQDSPTITLELGHIKFDLVPATSSFLFGLKIPDGSGGWQSTNPNDFNQTLSDKNKNNANLIKPTIRLAKIWNASNGYVFDSFSFEKWIVDLYFWAKPNNHRDFLFTVFDALSPHSESTQWRKDKINRAKEIVANVRSYERADQFDRAEREVKKLIKE